MGKLSKELGRLEVVLEVHVAVAAKEQEAKDLEEVYNIVNKVRRQRCKRATTRKRFLASSNYTISPTADSCDTAFSRPCSVLR